MAGRPPRLRWARGTWPDSRAPRPPHASGFGAAGGSQGTATCRQPPRPAPYHPGRRSSQSVGRQRPLTHILVTPILPRHGDTPASVLRGTFCRKQPSRESTWQVSWMRKGLYKGPGVGVRGGMDLRTEGTEAGLSQNRLLCLAGVLDLPWADPPGCPCFSSPHGGPDTSHFAPRASPPHPPHGLLGSSTLKTKGPRASAQTPAPGRGDKGTQLRC